MRSRRPTILKRMGEVLVIACNTATALALDRITEQRTYRCRSSGARSSIGGGGEQE